MGIENNPDIALHAERLLPDVESRISSIQEATSEAIRKIVLTVTFNDQVIKYKFKGMEIRGTTMAALVAKKILTILGEDPNTITLMAIGDVTLPEWIRGDVEDLIRKANEIQMNLIHPDEMDNSYDLTAQGCKPAREMALANWDKAYWFSEKEGLTETLADQSTIMPGGMTALKLVVDALNEEADEKGLIKRYIYPDNSFGTWKSISKKSSRKKLPKAIVRKLADPEKDGDTPLTQYYQLKTEQKDCLQLTPEKVHEFYKDKPLDESEYSDTWYVTPVGNPSGTKIDGEMLVQTCEAILQYNPNATIILDCVYLRTLEDDEAKALIGRVISNDKIMNRAVFVESLSKTHGITGHRVAMYFAKNKELFNMIQNSDTTFTAGHGHYISALMMAFMSAPPEIEKKFKELHRFWQRERKGLFDNLIGSGKYNHLFEEDQEQIPQEQVDQPLGLYLLLKLKDGVDPVDVYSETGCIGVETKMDTGKYMRFSVGKITEPTYSKEEI